MKGMTMGQFSAIAIGLVVAAFMISIGAEVLTGLAESSCSGADGTWGWYPTSYTIAPAASPAPTGGFHGCCSAYTGTNCTTWTSTVSTNITYQGLEGQETFGDWLPTIAVVIAAAVVIGVIVMYFRFG